MTLPSLSTTRAAEVTPAPALLQVQPVLTGVNRPIMLLPEIEPNMSSSHLPEALFPDVLFLFTQFTQELFGSELGRNSDEYVQRT